MFGSKRIAMNLHWVEPDFSTQGCHGLVRSRLVPKVAGDENEIYQRHNSSSANVVPPGPAIEGAVVSTPKASCDRQANGASGGGAAAGAEPLQEGRGASRANRPGAYSGRQR